jgi:methionyl-tRNA formyltransferase
MCPRPTSSGRRVAFLSAHVSGLVKLEYLQRHGFQAATIVTIPADIAAKNKVAGHVDFRAIAAKHGIPIHYVEQFPMAGHADREYFEAQKFDLLLISGWQRLVPDAILRTLRVGAIAEHGSGHYLPMGRGRAPVGWSIVHGHTRFVLHLFMATPGADDGPILDVKSFDINPHDSIATVYYKIGICSAQLFLKNQEAVFSGAARWMKAAKIEPTYFPKRTDADDAIDWKASTAEIYNHIRASSSPYPNARATLNGRVMRIEAAAPFDQRLDFFSEAIGEILAVFPDGSVLVKTVDGTLLLKEYSYDGPIEAGMCFSLAPTPQAGATREGAS